VELSDSTVSRMLSSVWVGAEKRSVGASERDEFLRAAWRVGIAGGSVGTERFVFLRTSSAARTRNAASALRLLAEARGTGAVFCAAQSWGANVTLLASMSLEGMGPCLAVEGPPTKERCWRAK
jgi:hypothetical protein